MGRREGEKREEKTEREISQELSNAITRTELSISPLDPRNFFCREERKHRSSLSLATSGSHPMPISNQLGHSSSFSKAFSPPPRLSSAPQLRPSVSFNRNTHSLSTGSSALHREETR